MRSTDHNSGGARTKAQRFGDLVADKATQAGYDLTLGSGGRARLARDIGMSQSAVGRMLDGKTLPMPHLLENIARTVRADVRDLLVTSGVISSQSWPKDTTPNVLSATSQIEQLSPEGVADSWGITDPGIRDMLIGSAHNAIRLQAEADRRVESGEALGRR